MAHTRADQPCVRACNYVTYQNSHCVYVPPHSALSLFIQRPYGIQACTPRPAIGSTLELAATYLKGRRWAVLYPTILRGFVYFFYKATLTALDPLSKGLGMTHEAKATRIERRRLGLNISSYRSALSRFAFAMSR